MTRMAIELPFDHVSNLVAETLGLTVDGEWVRRVAEGIGDIAEQHEPQAMELIFTHKFLAASSPSSSRVIVRGRVFSPAKNILIAVSQSKGIGDFLSNL